MLAKADAERTRLFVLTDAEVKISGSARQSVVQDHIFAYLNEKVPNLPENIFESDSFDHESGMLGAERIKTASLELWSSRLTEPDTEVPGRFWSLELTVGRNEAQNFFGSRLSCFSRHLDFYFDPAVPRVYRDLVSQNVLFGDGIRLSRSPIDISDSGDVDWLVALMKSPRRRRNIIALSSNEFGSCSANPNIFADRLCGVAHVVRIYPGASFKLSDAVGKFLSIFDMGIRVYRPSDQFDADDPLRHSLFTRHQLARLDRNRVQYLITSDAFRTSVEGSLKSQSIPTFVQIRSANASLKLAQLQAASTSGDFHTLEGQLKAAQEARIAAEAQARESLDLAVQEESVRKEAEDERDQEKARAMVLAARVRTLESQLDNSLRRPTKRPIGYDEIPSWVEAEFAGRMKLHPRALRGLREAEYEDVDCVCDAVELLATAYVDSKRGDREAWKRFEEGIRERAIEYSKSISGTRAGEQGDEYFVRYRGQRTFLEWHLKKGTSRSPRRDLRIYFFWDDEDEEVVLGYLPSHLDTRIT